MNGPGSSLSFLLASCCLPLEEWKPFFVLDRTGFEFCTALVTLGKLYYFSKPQFPGGLKSSGSWTNKKYKCAFSLWSQVLETNSNQSQPFTLKTPYTWLWGRGGRKPAWKDRMMQVWQKGFFGRAKLSWRVVATSSTLLRKRVGRLSGKLCWDWLAMPDMGMVRWEEGRGTIYV